ncbi:MAG: FAD-dependent oxidoreductase [Ilumatobacteraceae bacterium]
MKIGVIGAGVLGMRLAQRLREDGHDVTLFEAAPGLGGLAAPWRLGGATWDRHYHVTLLSDSRTREMYDSLGLSGDCHWVQTKTGYFGTDHVLRPVSTPLEFFKLPDLTLIDKLRLGGTMFLASLIRNGHHMERIGVDRWLRRWSGKRAFTSFWEPLLRAKMGDLHEHASAAFIWATVQRLGAARRSGLEEERFGYVTGGYARVCGAFADWFAAHGVKVRLSTPVRSVRRAADGAGLDVVVAGGDGAMRFDDVVVTTAAPLAAQLCPDLLDGERRRLERVQYVGIVCTSLLLRRPLSPYYLTYITDPSTAFTAVVEMTSLIEPAEVGGHALVYLPKYTTTDDPLFSASDDEVIAELMPYLRTIARTLTDDDIVATGVSRVAQVFAIPTLGYSESAPSVTTSIPGLYLAGSTNLPFSTLNVNDTLSLVDVLLRAIRPVSATS